MKSIFNLIAFFLFCTQTSFAGFEDTSIQTFDGLNLRALWTTPNAAPVKGVAVILQGSGKVGISGDVSGPFLGNGYQGQRAALSEQIALQLESLGVASLRFAKRGCDHPADQAFVYSDVNLYKQDAIAALEMSKQRYPGLPIFLIGFSEGGFVATLTSTEFPVHGLFLLAPVAQDIDSVLRYQFQGWPFEKVTSLDTNIDGVLSAQELAILDADPVIPMLEFAGLTNWRSIDQNQDGALDLINEVTPFYSALLQNIMGLAQTREFTDWYHSLQAAPAFSELLTQSQATHRFAYQGALDTQVEPTYVVSAFQSTRQQNPVRIYPELSHCFSPLEGIFQNRKTSGPFDAVLLRDLSTDIQSILE